MDGKRRHANPVVSTGLDDIDQSRIRIYFFIILIIVTVMLVRLWTMQVIASDSFEQRSETQRLRELPLQATRGLILDRSGEIMVDNRLSMVVSVDQDAPITPENIMKWSEVVGASTGDIEKSIEYSTLHNAVGRRVLALDVDEAAVARISERSSEYPELNVSMEAVRDYPRGQVGSHLLGYTGEITEEQLAREKYESYLAGDIVGKGGIELMYEGVLSGIRGTDVLEVDASGNPTRRVDRIPPAPGHSVKLALDSSIQQAAEIALEEATALARANGMKDAKEGAAVVMDVRTGGIVALASYPTYDPSVFIDGISFAEWDELNHKDSGYPLLNRAVMSSYAPASTFKPFVAYSALSNGLITQNHTVNCKGKWQGSTKWQKIFRDWKPSGHGTVGMTEGIAQSCDVFFYDVGYKLYNDKGEPLQDYVRNFGFGVTSDVDLPFEANGRIPTAAWKAAFNKDLPELQEWLPGDSINISIGQGDLLVSPLQLAIAYSAIANGGTLYKPHAAQEVLGADGRVIRRIEPEVVREISEVEKFSLVKRGLERVITDGTGEGAFKGFNGDVAGKTGTAEVRGKDDFAWFASYGPVDDPRYAVVVMVEQGGHGGSIAAPAARKIWGALYGVESVDTRLVRASDSSR